MKASGIDNETLRQICIANDWFTCGTNEEYEKLFAMNRKGATTGELATYIFLHTDKGEYKEIFIKLLEAGGK